MFDRRPAFTAVGGAYQLEERLVLRDRELRPVAEHPATRGEVAGEHPDLTDVWLSHRVLSLVRGGEDALQRDAEGQHQERLLVGVGLTATDVRDRVRRERRVRGERLVGGVGRG